MAPPRKDMILREFQLGLQRDRIVLSLSFGTRERQIGQTMRIHLTRDVAQHLAAGLSKAIQATDPSTGEARH